MVDVRLSEQDVGGLCLGSCCMAGDFSLRLKMAVYDIYVFQAILCGCKARWLKESDMGIL